MTIEFNADEILQIAEEIEKDGAIFYRNAAEKTVDPNSKKLLQNLAEKEVQYEKAFAEMRKHLSRQEKEETNYDPDHEDAMYLQTMADKFVFSWMKEPFVALSGTESTEMILWKAIELKKDAIVFYLRMKEMVPHKFGREKVDEIIRQELRHITDLSRELAALKQ